MEIKRIAAATMLLAWMLSHSMGAQEKHGLNPTGRDIAKWNDADLTAWVSSALDRGLPADLGDYLSVASLNRSSVVVPLTEKKIEEVLKSNSPATCFSDPTVDPKRFIGLATGMIIDAGDENSLRGASMLMRIDEGRFGDMVKRALLNANADGYRNPFVVAYRGFDLADPAVDRRIIEWAAPLLSSEIKYTISRTKRLWAEAMLDRYGVVPNDAQWASDPLASRLSATLAASVKRDVTRMAVEALEKRAKQ